jgi:hypothetical protein
MISSANDLKSISFTFQSQGMNGFLLQLPPPPHFSYQSSHLAEIKKGNSMWKYILCGVRFCMLFTLQIEGKFEEEKKNTSARRIKWEGWFMIPACQIQ